MCQNIIFLFLYHNVGDLTSTRDDNVFLLYISGCKPHFISQFYEVELGLKSTSQYDIRAIFEFILVSVC